MVGRDDKEGSMTMMFMGEYTDGKKVKRERSGFGQRLKS